MANHLVTIEVYLLFASAVGPTDSSVAWKDWPVVCLFESWLPPERLEYAEVRVIH